MNFRSDLAIENKDMYLSRSKEKEVDIEGVKLEKNQYGDINVIRIKILDDKGVAALGKPMGTYVTVEMPRLGDMTSGSDDLKEAVAMILGGEIKRLIHFHEDMNVFVAGIGNREVTPDALGPITASKVKVTRNYFLVNDEKDLKDVPCVSGISPGVAGSTGIESAELIKSVAGIVKPEAIIAIDSLAARDVERIATTIQLCDTGISPGAGTGNMRKELNENTVGTKVIAIGVPTVIDSKALILDTLEGFLKEGSKAEEYIDSLGMNMIVTSFDIDQTIKDFSDIISNGINIALHSGIYS